MRTDRLIEAAFPDCVYLVQFAIKHTKQETQTNGLKIFMFLHRAFWYNCTAQSKEMYNFLN